MSVEALKFGQITSLMFIVLHIFLRHFVYIILHKLNILKDASLD